MEQSEALEEAPTEVYARRLDEDETYLCSPRTTYRILDSAKEVRVGRLASLSHELAIQHICCILYIGRRYQVRRS